MELEVYFDGNLVSHPLGWQGLNLTLERHKDYHGIIEYVDSEFIWIGSAADYILNEFNTNGFAAIINVDVVLKINGVQNTIYSGILDIKLLEIIHITQPLKIKCPVIANSTWSKLIANKDTKVNLLANRTLSGTTVPTLSTTVTLSGQTIVHKFKLSQKLTGTNNDSLINNPMYLMHYFTPEISNVDNVEDYGTQISTENPLETRKYFLKAKYSGKYTFNYRSAVSIATNFNFQVTWYYAVNDNAVQIGSGNGVTILSEIVLEKTFDYFFSVNLNEGDEVYFYGVLQRTSGTNSTIYRYNSHIIIPPNIYLPDGLTVYSSIDIDVETVFNDTTATGILYDNAIKKAIQIATDSTATVQLPIKIFLTNGKLIRQLNAIINATFHELVMNYSSISPIGVDDNNGNISVLDASNFYKNEQGVRLDITDSYVIKPDIKQLVRSVEVGYTKYESESAYGVNDTHASQTWVNELSFGEERKMLCSYIASAISIEQTRRMGVNGDKDWRLDEDNFVIVLKSDNTPEKTSESGIPSFPLLDDHYNSRIVPGENIKRVADLLSTQKLTFKLISYKGAKRLFENDYTANAFLTCNLIEVEIPMDFDTYLQIKQDRYKKIILNTGGDNIPIYLERLEYGIFAGKAKIIGYLAVRDDYGFSLGFTTGFDA
ncbi:MAG: hypothetical protein KatS3mg031_2941 [Chitinophagales bacterium]|nr:MAG: hypothetical protein KatS3mg031_2941 [Chitinophagales bacterium]